MRYRTITETRRTWADPDQRAMASLRYSLVARFASGKRLLDVACGSGYLLPRLADEEVDIVACDIDPANVRDARRAVPRARIVCGDVDSIDFDLESFDVISCLEAIYYFVDWKAFIERASGLLARSGTLIITWPNPGRPDFVPSPYSTAYPTSSEISAAATEQGLAPMLYGAFPTENLLTESSSFKRTLRSHAARYGIIPRALRTRMLVKLMLHRGMKPLGSVTLLADPELVLTEISALNESQFTMLYLVAHKQGQST